MTSSTPPSAPQSTVTNDDIAFSILRARDIEALRSRGTLREVKRGEVLFEEGDLDFCFFVVLRGAIEIVESSRGTPHTVVVHGPGHFTGDADTLTGRAALVTARVMEPGVLLQLSAAELRRAVDEMPEFGEQVLKAFLMRRTLLLDEGFEGVRIIGSRFSPDAHKLRDFATRNAVPFTWIDLDTDQEAETLLRQFNVSASQTPIVIDPGGSLYSNPSITDFARCMGLAIDPEPDHLYDLVVVGAGPAGLAASVYAASEGLSVFAIDAVAAGGQAGTSTRIENYLGFPTGISGAELTRNALLQANKFGAQVTVPAVVKSLSLAGGTRIVTLEDGTVVRSRCILVASGVTYRKLEVPGFSEFEGRGVYYAATDMEARMCRNEETVVVGGGNSAGQAIMFLSRYARHVHVVVRGNDLGASMSRYLVDRIGKLENVTVHYGATVSALEGEGRLSVVRAKSTNEGELVFDVGALYLFIGADARTSWLRGCVELDNKGFVLTGTDLAHFDFLRRNGRPPFMLETSLPGVFAAGDVRSGSVKRVASAVGEGAMAVSFVHAHIARPV